METRSYLISHLEYVGFKRDETHSKEGDDIYKFVLNETLFILVEFSQANVNVCCGIMKNNKKFVKSTSMMYKVISLFDKPINQLRDLIDQTMSNCLNQMMCFVNEEEPPLRGL